MANIPVQGEVNGNATTVQVRWNGGLWQTLPVTSGVFSGTLVAQPQGQGALEVRAWGYPLAVVDPVGIGDVFVIAGQSNASGHTTATHQVAQHPTLRASVFGNDYQWRGVLDPVDSPTGQVDVVSLDQTAVNGTWWPLLATHIMADQNVPVAFVPAAKGGTMLASWLPSSDHEDRTTLYGSMIYRARQVGGVRAILWHQGESDAATINSTPPDLYRWYLGLFADAIAADLSVPLVAGRIHYWTIKYPTTTPDRVAGINGAITGAADTHPTILLGPDFSRPNLTDYLHFSTDPEMVEVASRWWVAVQQVLYPPE